MQDSGLSGVKYESEPFDFGEGVVLSHTYAHLMNPYFMAFSPAEPGQAHPAPWKAARGGHGFDVTVQLEVPATTTAATFDHLNTVWWFVALLRLKASSVLRVPVVSDQAFAEVPTNESEPSLWPIETNRCLVFAQEFDQDLQEKDLRWVKDNWSGGSKLMSDSDFNTAMQAFDQCANTWYPALALMMLWGALERLFSPARYELRFRVSATIAAYLLPPGTERQQKYNRIKKLYDARSKVAHGSDNNDPATLSETYTLMRTVLIKMIEERHVPKRAELEAALFGA